MREINFRIKYKIFRDDFATNICHIMYSYYSIQPTAEVAIQFQNKCTNFYIADE